MYFQRNSSSSKICRSFGHLALYKKNSLSDGHRIFPCLRTAARLGIVVLEECKQKPRACRKSAGARKANNFPVRVTKRLDTGTTSCTCDMTNGNHWTSWTCSCHMCEAAPDQQFARVDPGIYTAILGQMTAPGKLVASEAHKQRVPPDINSDLPLDDAEQQSSGAY